jgi:predicted O-methyltransferase YrrM
MVRYIGDLSKQDVKVLVEFSTRSKNILEFGVGGSTQVMAQSTKGNITSVDTSIEWINLTKDNLNILGITKDVSFVIYDDWKRRNYNTKYDMIFNDGISNLRQEFMELTWDLLKVGGHMIFHDTRVNVHKDTIIDLYIKKWSEIEHILVNTDDSNMTVIKKKRHTPYVNWNKKEGREAWMRGTGNRPDDFLKRVSTVMFNSIECDE